MAWQSLMEYTYNALATYPGLGNAAPHGRLLIRFDYMGRLWRYAGTDIDSAAKRTEARSHIHTHRNVALHRNLE